LDADVGLGIRSPIFFFPSYGRLAGETTFKLCILNITGRCAETYYKLINYNK